MRSTKCREQVSCGPILNQPNVNILCVCALKWQLVILSFRDHELLVKDCLSSSHNACMINILLEAGIQYLYISAPNNNAIYILENIILVTQRKLCMNWSKENVLGCFKDVSTCPYKYSDLHYNLQSLLMCAYLAIK